MSTHHVRLDQVLWRKARRAALERAGWRSELSGLAGRLEVHHLVRLEDGGAPYDADNLQVLTRAEHIAMHRTVTPAQAAWDRMIDEVMSDIAFGRRRT